MQRQMTFAEFESKMSSSGTRAEDMKVARDIGNGDATAPFSQFDVTHDTRGEFQVTEHGVWVNEVQFKELVGHTPSECSVKSVTAINSRGQHIKGYALRDPAHPYATWSLSGVSSLVRREYAQQAESHYLPKQGQWSWEWMLQRRSKGDFGAKGTVGTTVYSVDELRGRAACRAAEQEVEGGEVKVDDDDDDADEGAERIVRAGSGIIATPTKGKVPRLAGDVQDGASQDGGTACSSEGGSVMKDGRRQGPLYWIQTLNLCQILSGEKKVGREKGFAEKCVQNCRERTAV